MLNGRSRITVLLDNLSNVTRHFWQVDSKQDLTHLLVVSHCAREICQKFCAGKVWLLDATYKTNKFGMPLFHVVGATASHQSFTFAYCFMQNETAADYRWAANHLRDLFQEYNLPTNDVTFVTDRGFALMGALQDIFPNANMLLCRWHINKIISARHKKASQQKLGKHF